MMRIFVCILFLLISGASFQRASAAIQCSGIFISYEKSLQLKASAEDSIRALAQMRLDIDREQARGGRSLTSSVLAANYATKEKQLLGYFEVHGLMTREAAMEKLKLAISRLQNEKKEDVEIAKEETAIRKDLESIHQAYPDRTRVVFNTIEPGSFKIKSSVWYRPRKKVTITKPFQMMAYVTTKYVWHKIINLAHKNPLPPHPSLRFFQENHRIDENDPKINLLPVTWRSHDNIMEWIEILNHLSKVGEPELSRLIKEHKPGDIYRLPTEAEWEFVIRDRGRSHQRFPFGENLKDLNDYAWHNGNSDGGAHPVGEKKPIIIDGQKFYDLLGNVDELVSDYYKHEMQTGVDPGPHLQEASNSGRTVRGGNFMMTPESLTSYVRRPYFGAENSRQVGFRLVRELNPPTSVPGGMK